METRPTHNEVVSPPMIEAAKPTDAGSDKTPAPPQRDETSSTDNPTHGAAVQLMINETSAAQAASNKSSNTALNSNNPQGHKGDKDEENESPLSESDSDRENNSGDQLIHGKKEPVPRKKARQAACHRRRRKRRQASRDNPKTKE